MSPPPPFPNTHRRTPNFIILEKYFSSIAEKESDLPKLMQKQGRFPFFSQIFSDLPTSILVYFSTY